ICMTGLPIAHLSELGSARFKAFSRLFFPKCRLSLDQALRRAIALHESLQALAQARNVTWIQQSSDWYGFDPIHIRRRHWPSAWRDILSAWDADDPLPSPVRGSLSHSLYLQSRKPYRRTWFGCEQQCDQPSARLKDGTAV